MMRDGPAVLVRGLNDVASAVAWRLFKEGYGVAMHQEADAPKTHRRQMAFADAFFDDEVVLEGVVARRCARVTELNAALRDGSLVPIVVGDVQSWLGALRWHVLVDARMRKRVVPESQCGMAPLTIGLGPGHRAGETADIAVETNWGERLGTALRDGSTLPLAGEPRMINGVGRERNVYSPVSGELHSDCRIGDSVSAGDLIATIGSTAIHAPISGTLRGVTRPGVFVSSNDKIVEVDPRPPERAGFRGLGERPRRIADGVAQAIHQWMMAGMRVG